jgi:hypothetical protein
MATMPYDAQAHEQISGVEDEQAVGRESERVEQYAFLLEQLSMRDRRSLWPSR